MKFLFERQFAVFLLATFFGCAVESAVLPIDSSDQSSEIISLIPAIESGCSGGGCKTGDSGKLGNGDSANSASSRLQDDPNDVMRPNYDPFRNLPDVIARNKQRRDLLAMTSPPPREPVAFQRASHKDGKPASQALKSEHSPDGCAAFTHFRGGDVRECSGAEWCPLELHPCAVGDDISSCCVWNTALARCAVISLRTENLFVDCALNEDGDSDCDDVDSSLPMPEPTTSPSPSHSYVHLLPITADDKFSDTVTSTPVSSGENVDMRLPRTFASDTGHDSGSFKRATGDKPDNPECDESIIDVDGLSTTSAQGIVYPDLGLTAAAPPTEPVVGSLLGGPRAAFASLSSVSDDIAERSVEDTSTVDRGLLVAHSDAAASLAHSVGSGLFTRTTSPPPAESDTAVMLHDRPAVIATGSVLPLESSEVNRKGDSTFFTSGQAARIDMRDGSDDVDCSQCPRSSSGVICSARGECNDVKCICHAGWAGEACENVRCPGWPHQCLDHGQCRDGRCSCHSGWSGVECEIPVCPGQPACSGNGKCVRNHTCHCNEGWKGDACEKLVCPSTDGGDECAGRGLCFYGVCYCDAGFAGTDCAVVVCPGAPHQCSGMGGCINGTCTCASGWKGDSCDQRRCEGPRECWGHGVCVDGACVCDSGWRGGACEVPMCPSSDINECSGHGVCDQGRCLCSAGWWGEACAYRSCPDDGDATSRWCSGHGECGPDGRCTCREGWDGATCGLISCTKSCGETGHCVNGTCQCLPGYRGNACEIKTCPTDLAGLECHNQGSCVHGHCVCREGFKGFACEDRACPGFSWDSPAKECSSHGLCRNGACLCLQGRRGDDCSELVCPSVGGLECSSRGNCSGESGICTCEEGFDGIACANKKCPAPPGHDTVPCAGHGGCLDGVCVCDSGWQGDDCSMQMECQAVPPCPGDPMCGGKQRGVCDTRTRMCNCMPGWTGASCEVPLRVCNGGSAHTECGVDCHFVCDDDCLVNISDTLAYTCGCEDQRDLDPSTCVQKCACPTAKPVWNPLARKCVAGDSCPLHSECGMPLLATGMEADIVVQGVPCDGAVTRPNGSETCVCANKHILGCWRAGLGLATSLSGSEVLGLQLHDHSSADNTTALLLQADIPVSSGVDSTLVASQTGRYTLAIVRGSNVAALSNSMVDSLAQVVVHAISCDAKSSSSCDVSSEGTECSGNGVCAAGVCVCDPGWTGSACDVLQNCPGATGSDGVLCSGHGRCMGCHCICHPGWSGADCSLPSCPNGCSGNGACVEGECICSQGWSGADCARDTISDACPRGNNGFECANQGYCVAGTCECAHPFAGPSCESKACPGHPDDCSGNGQCNPFDGKCTCSDGWSGVRCDEPVCPSAVVGEPCSGNGLCLHGTCHCMHTHQGDDCATKRCLGTPSCSGRGQCVDGLCACNAGWGGAACDQHACPRPSQVDRAELGSDTACSGNGICLDSTRTCLCLWGFEGIACESASCTADCSGRGECIAGSCRCYDGWTGVTCQESNCAFGNKDDKPCSGHGVCVEGRCVCDPTYTGQDCSVLQCPLSSDGRPCSGNGLCVEGTCQCHGSYVGPDCGSPRCPYDCNDQGRCVNGACLCGPAWTGIYCDEQRVHDSSSRECSSTTTGMLWLVERPDTRRAECVPTCDQMVSPKSHPDCYSQGTSGCTCPDGDVWDYAAQSCKMRGLACDEQPFNRSVDPATGRTVCYAGYSGVLCDEKLCIGHDDDVGSCWDRGTCIDGTCACDDGFAGLACERAACSGECLYGECAKNGTCICNPGATGALCDRRECPSVSGEICAGAAQGTCDERTGHCVCTPGFVGAACEDRSCRRSNSTGYTCDGHGDCNKLTGVCACAEGWTGSACDIASNDCSGRGFQLANGVCLCEPFASGTHCEIITCPRGADGTTCMGRGLCDTEKGVCHCYDDWAGAACESRACAANCSGHGTCNGGVCNCDEAWHGEECAFKACPGDCSHNGRCVGGVCRCYHGFRGSNCAYTTCPGFPLECNGHGVCGIEPSDSLAVGSGRSVCHCDTGFAGEDCMLELPLHQIRVTDGNGTVEPHQRCEFPFEFSGKVYTSCTMDFAASNAKGRPWCSTTAKWDQMWAPCLPVGRCMGAGGVECSSHGVCGRHAIQGVCVCDSGWDGADCSIPSVRVTTSVDVKVFTVTATVAVAVHVPSDMVPLYASTATSALARTANLPTGSVVGDAVGATNDKTLSVRITVTMVGHDSADLAVDRIVAATDSDSNAYVQQMRAWGVLASDSSLANAPVISDVEQLCWRKSAASHFCGWDASWTVTPAATAEDCFALCDAHETCGVRGIVDFGHDGTAGSCVLDAPCTPHGFALYVRHEHCSETQATEFHGRACHFPFEYRGKVYTECTREFSPSGREWCSTTRSYRRRWGFCAPKGMCPGRISCSGHGTCNNFAQCECENGWEGDDCSSRVRRVVVGNSLDGSERGQACTIPFNYGGKQYDDCTNAPHGFALEWCRVGRMSNEIADENWGEEDWGFCAPRGTCPGYPECDGHGECIDSKCDCDLGRAGEACDVDAKPESAINAFFGATGGISSWHVHDGWSSTPWRCSQTVGVHCDGDDSSTRVARIELSRNGLDGTIPKQLGILTDLVVLDVSHNWVGGTIPSDLGLITNLEALILADTRLVGAIPTELGALGNLKIFDISDTYLGDATFESTLASWSISSLSCDSSCAVHDTCRRREERDC